jgi:nucleoside-diphosphate-sugar epimerase
MLSSRKVYKAGANLKETSILKPRSNYSKNKLRTEKTLLKILKEKILILRISNVVGLNKRKNNLHKVFTNIFYENAKKGLIFDNKNSYKDFIPVNKFCEIVEKLITFNAYGIYNVSLGKKIFLKEIVSWLNLYNNKKNIKYVNLNKKYQSDSFTLNNDKLMNTIKIKNTTQDLKKYCVKLSKELFKNH